MATPATIAEFPSERIATDLLLQFEVLKRAQVIANWLQDLLPGTAAVVYVVRDLEAPSWSAAAVAGEVAVGEVAEYDTGTLGAIAEGRAPQTFHGEDLRREYAPHLDLRQSDFSLGYAPLMLEESVIGALEVVSFETTFPPEAEGVLTRMAEIASPAIAAALSYESERHATLQSISRVTQMYDLEKVFNSTLEMEELLDMIAKKFRDVMDVQAINLWMVSGDALELVSQAGYDATCEVGASQAETEGIAGSVSTDGASVLIDDPDDERLQQRNAGIEDGAVFSVLAAPLMDREALVGVVEAINRSDGQPFDEDDEFFLSTICETANNALHNADLLQTERKVEVLEALVKVSGEITSTLDLDRVLQAIVNEPATVIPYERAAIALEQRGRLVVRAVTGMPRADPGDPEVARLQEILQWASLSGESLMIAQHGDEISTDREETRAKFAAYFQQTGMRGFHSVPLADDDGRVGILAFQSSDPDFLNIAHLEMIKVLAGQATVSLRNASLYREVPFIDVLEPILARKRKFLALSKGRRAVRITTAAAVLIFLAVVPLPLRVGGAATVAPAHTAPVQPAVAGVVQHVYVREGQNVAQGAILATLDDWQYRDELAVAQAKYRTAIAQMDRALAANDGAEAGILQAQTEIGAAQVERAKERVAQATLRAPMAGRIATPHVEDSTGRNLNPGDTFAEVVDTANATVDVAIDDTDAGLLKAGQPAAVKLEGLPSRTLHGTVSVVSPKGELVGNEREFYARIDMPNPDGAIRPGMLGRGKINTGWRPAGWVLFRGPILWLWTKLWSWFGW